MATRSAKTKRSARAPPPPGSMTAEADAPPKKKLAATIDGGAFAGGLAPSAQMTSTTPIPVPVPVPVPLPVIPNPDDGPVKYTCYPLDWDECTDELLSACTISSSAPGASADKVDRKVDFHLPNMGKTGKALKNVVMVTPPLQARFVRFTNFGESFNETSEPQYSLCIAAGVSPEADLADPDIKGKQEGFFAFLRKLDAHVAEQLWQDVTVRTDHKRAELIAAGVDMAVRQSLAEVFAKAAIEDQGLLAAEAELVEERDAAMAQLQTDVARRCETDDDDDDDDGATTAAEEMMMFDGVERINLDHRKKMAVVSVQFPTAAGVRKVRESFGRHMSTPLKRSGDSSRTDMLKLSRSVWTRLMPNPREKAEEVLERARQINDSVVCRNHEDAKKLAEMTDKGVILNRPTIVNCAGVDISTTYPVSQPIVQDGHLLVFRFVPHVYSLCGAQGRYGYGGRFWRTVVLFRPDRLPAPSASVMKSPAAMAYLPPALPAAPVPMAIDAPPLQPVAGYLDAPPFIDGDDEDDPYA